MVRPPLNFFKGLNPASLEQIPLISVSSPVRSFSVSLFSQSINESDSDIGLFLLVSVELEVFEGEKELDGEGEGENVVELPKPLIWEVILRALRRASLNSSFPKRRVRI